MLAEWQNRRRLQDDSLGARLVQELQEKCTGDTSRIHQIRPVYVACFCEDDNLLSQWRAYGQSGGYSIGFPVPAGMHPEPSNYTAEWTKVEYDKAKQSAKCRYILDAVLPILDDEDTAQALLRVDSHQVLGYSRFRKVVEELLLDEIISFKQSAFEEEQEWRIVVLPRELLKQGTDDGGKTPPRLYFRSSQGIVIPYVRLLPVEGKLPIHCIRFGPSLDRKRAEASIAILLEANGFRDVAVDGSDIPLNLQSYV